MVPTWSSPPDHSAFGEMMPVPPARSPKGTVVTGTGIFAPDPAWKPRPCTPAGKRVPVATWPPAGAGARWAVTVPDRRLWPVRPALAGTLLVPPEDPPEPVAVACARVWPAPALAAPAPVLTDVAG